MKKKKQIFSNAHLLFLVVFGLVIVSCETNKQEESKSEKTKGLKDSYKEYFTIGVAVSPFSLKDSSGQLIKQHFASLTAENTMKMGPIHPKEDSFNWEYSDQIIAFARANQMKVRGHALCWHNQAPDWFFTDTDGNQVSKEVLLERLKTHITAVMTRYKDDVYAWDVVNEAISDSDDEVYRKSKFYEIAGDEFIIKAFEFAHAVDSNAILFYNDYDVVSPIKRQKIYHMIKDFKEAGVPIGGIGIQAHWSIYYPTGQVIQETIDQFSDLDIAIQITELDVSVYKGENNARERTADDIDVLTEEMKRLHAAKYDTIFQVLRANKEKISAVTFWNVSDRYSWLDFFPVRGRKNYPLLFDQKFQPKESYFKIIDFE